MASTKSRRGLALVACAGLASSFAQTTALPAHAQIVNEITASWATPVPASLANGAPALMHVNVNANDDKGAAGVQDPLIAKVVLTKGAIKTMPVECQSTSTPASSISADGATLTCNLGKVTLGTAKQFDLGVLAAGADGDKLTATVSTGTAAPVQLAPIPITATAGVDLYMADNVVTSQPAGGTASTPVLNLPFSLAVPVGAEGIKGDFSFDIEVTDTGSSNNKLSEYLQTLPLDEDGSNSILGNQSAVYPATPKNNNTITPNSEPEPKIVVTRNATGLHVEITGLDTTTSNLPTTMVNGSAVPSDRQFLVTGVVRVGTAPGLFSAGDPAIAASFAATNVGATTLSGKPAADVDPSNQTETRVLTQAGSTLAQWNYSDDPTNNTLVGQGQPWTNAGYVLPGDIAYSTVASSEFNGTAPNAVDHGYGLCSIIDTAKAELASTTWRAKPGQTPLPAGTVAIDTSAKTDVDLATSGNQYPEPMAYLGSIADPTTFDCGSSDNWVPLSEVTDPSKVSAVRESWTADQWSASVSRMSQVTLPLKIKAGAVGSDIWTFGVTTGTSGSGYGKLAWGTFASQPKATTGSSLTGDRHTTMTNKSDVIHIADHRTGAVKDAAEVTMKAGETAQFTIKGTYSTATGAGESPLTLVDTMPKGLDYEVGSASIAPTSVVKNADGTTTLTWDKQTTTKGAVSVTYRAKALVAGAFTNTVSVTNAGSMSGSSPALDKANASASITAQDVSETVLDKTATSTSFAINGANTWHLSLTNEDASRTQDVYDIVDVLPYNGDANGSKFRGSYTVGDVTPPAGATVYYTDAAPASLKGDPNDASNGAFGKPSAIWTTTKPATVTGIRVVGTELAPLAKVSFDIPFTTKGNLAGDTYNNMATAKATLTELKMVRAASSSVAAEGSKLQIDKVADADQVLEQGKPYTYTVTVKNNGTGTAHDVKMTEIPGVGLDKTITMDGASQGTASGAVWTVGDLGAGRTATIKVHAVVAKDANLTVPVQNKAIVENPSNPHDPNGPCVVNEGVDADTDQCDVTSDKEDSKLQVDKAVTSQVIKHGGTMTWKISAKNVGPDAAANVVVTDKAMPGIDAASLKIVPDGNVGTATGNVWKVGSMKAGDVVTATVTAKIAADADLTKPILNGVVVSNPSHPKDPSDPGTDKCVVNTGDVTSDTDQCDVVPLSENSVLKIHKIEDKKLVKPGEIMTYTLQGVNEGKGGAAKVVITDLPKSGLASGSMVLVGQPSKGSIDPKTGIWTVGDLKVGEKVEVKVTVKVADDAKADSMVVNAATIGNPSHPAPTGDQCKANATLTGDDDQCDVVEAKVVVPPVKPVPPAPVQPNNNGGGNVGLSSGLTGEDASVAGALASLLAGLGVAGGFIARRRKGTKD